MFVITISSAKGGTGRTTLSVNLAAIFATRGFSTGIIEFDPQNFLVRNFVAAPSSLTETALQQIQNNLSLLSYRPLLQGETLSSQLDKLLNEMRDHGCDVVIIDTPAQPHPMADLAIKMTDAVVYVYLCDDASYQVAEAAQSSTGVSHHPHYIYVVNQFNPTRNRRRNVYKQWQSQFVDCLLPVPIHQDEAVAEALVVAKPVVTFTQHSQASHDFHGVADWLIKHWLKPS